MPLTFSPTQHKISLPSMGNKQSNTPPPPLSIAQESMNTRSTAKQSFEVLRPLLKTGDIIFFKNSRPSLIVPAKEGEWTSANVIIKFSQENLISVINAAQNFVPVAEALRTRHVVSGAINIIEVDDKMRYQNAPGELTYNEMCVLRLKGFSLDSKKAEMLGVWLKDTVGTEQRTQALDAASCELLSSSQEISMDSSEFFSVKLVSEFYRAIGVLKNVDISKITSPQALKHQLEASNLNFERPVILEVDASHKPRTWQQTLSTHGDYGRHPSHSEMVKSQDDSEWQMDIPPNPQNAFQQARSVRDHFLELDASKKSTDPEKAAKFRLRALNLFEIALMNEFYYHTGHVTEKKSKIFTRNPFLTPN